MAKAVEDVVDSDQEGEVGVGDGGRSVKEERTAPTSVDLPPRLGKTRRRTLKLAAP